MSAAEQLAASVPFEVVCDSADRSKWLAARRHSIGASESAAVLGHAPSWTSAYALWAEKTGRVEPDSLDDVEAVFWGNTLETAIIRGYGARTGRRVAPFGLMLRSTRWPWLTATPDALTSETATDGEAKRMEGVLHELQCAIALGSALVPGLAAELHASVVRGQWWPLQTKNIGFGSAEHWADGVPVYYRIQCAHEALVFGSTRTTGAALVAGQRLAWDDIDVDTDGVLERQIVNLTKRFISEHVETGIAPDPDASESARNTLSKLFPLQAPGKQVVLGAAAMERAYELETAKARLKAAKEEADRIENLIRAEIGDAEIAVYPDGSAHTFKAQTRKATMTAESTFRVLRRKQAKEG